MPHTTIKAQALADFITEYTFLMQSSAEHTKEITPEESDSDSWQLFVDGSSTQERAGACLILKSPEGFTIQQAITFSFPVTNNQAEYEALLVGLRLSRTLQVQNLIVHSDSQIVVK